MKMFFILHAMETNMCTYLQNPLHMKTVVFEFTFLARNRLKKNDNSLKHKHFKEFLNKKIRQNITI